MCGRRAHQSVRDKKRNGFISDAIPHARPRPGTREVACGAGAKRAYFAADVLRLERATMATAIELRLHSCSQFSVFFHIFKRGGVGQQPAGCRPTDLTERTHYTCTFGHTTVFARVLNKVYFAPIVVGEADFSGGFKLGKNLCTCT